jgi:Hypothetical protein TTHB210
MLLQRTLSRSLMLTTLAALAACSSDSETSPTTDAERHGTSVTIGNGTAYTYVVNGVSGPSSIGVALSRGALDSLPAVDAMWTLALPADSPVAPYDHITINWNAQGHPPGPYMVPHFDFHFYTIPPAAQASIPGGADSTPVPAANVPKDYVSGVQSVPDMGVHWIDTTSAELHGHPFDETFIYGFSHGSLVFVEPMITRAFLIGQPDVSAAIKQPQSFAKTGRYPSRYRVHVDAATNTIRVSLDSLVER